METPQVSNSSQGRISVVVADDHPAMLSGIIHELERHPDMVVLGTVENGDQALHLAQTLQPDVLLLDFSMPGLRTVAVVRRVREMKLPTRIVLLVADNDSSRVTEVLQAGAHAYLLKNESLEAISNAVRAVMRGEMPPSPIVEAGVARKKVLGAAEQTQADLTTREQEVLRQLAKEKSNQEIGNCLHISERTVRFHLGNIYSKLGLKDRDATLAWVIRHGLDEE
jgi:NarL family two-component system response regulator LiaR